MFITITSNTEPTTRPDGSPLQEADKWVNNDVTKVWQIGCYSQEDLEHYNDLEDESTYVDANTYILDIPSPDYFDANTTWPDMPDPETLEVTELLGQWVVEGEELVIEVDGVTFRAEPLPIFDESDLE